MAYPYMQIMHKDAMAFVTLFCSDMRDSTCKTRRRRYVDFQKKWDDQVKQGKKAAHDELKKVKVILRLIDEGRSTKARAEHENVTEVIILDESEDIKGDMHTP